MLTMFCVIGHCTIVSFMLAKDYKQYYGYGLNSIYYSMSIRTISIPIDKLINLDRLQYTCLCCLGRNCKCKLRIELECKNYLGIGRYIVLSNFVPTNRNHMYSMNHPNLVWKYLNRSRFTGLSMSITSTKN